MELIFKNFDTHDEKLKAKARYWEPVYSGERDAFTKSRFALLKRTLDEKALRKSGPMTCTLDHAFHGIFDMYKVRKSPAIARATRRPAL